VLINQWCNVVRWEKRTLPFLRTAEFLWQEGHTAHRTSEEAEEETQRMLEVYRDFIENELAIPVIPGQKTESEKFPGAKATYTVEALMPDGRALQSGTSHFFGQNFAQAFDISFQDLDGERRHAWTTSWGLSTRTVGALIMVHGDDAGLIIPPHVAPVHAVIVPIPAKTEEDERAIREAVKRIENALKPGYRVKTDWSDKTPGWKFNEWELRGVPIRLEVGPRDVKNGVATVVRRDNRAKQPVAESELAECIAEVLEDIQKVLFERARTFRDENTHTVESMDQFLQVMQGPRGFLRARWCGRPECEAAIKEQTGATIRCLPRGEVEDPGACVYCGESSERRALFARAY
jgi:prolyl-tRNA synthetase